MGPWATVDPLLCPWYRLSTESYQDVLGANEPRMLHCICQEAIERRSKQQCVQDCSVHPRMSDAWKMSIQRLTAGSGSKPDALPMDKMPET